VLMLEYRTHDYEQTLLAATHIACPLDLALFRTRIVLGGIAIVVIVILFVRRHRRVLIE